MRKPNNIIFHSVTVLFDEFMFTHCPDYRSPGHTRIRHEYPSEDNIPPEDGWFDDGGAYLPNMPNVPAGNIPPSVLQGPQVPPQPPVVPQQPAQPVGLQGPQGAPQQPIQPPAQQGSVQKPWFRPGLTPQQRDAEFREALRRDQPALGNDDSFWNFRRQ